MADPTTPAVDPPTLLPSEVWRAVIPRLGLCAVTEEGGVGYAWRWVRGEWRAPSFASCAHILAAWAMAERTRAERAEAQLAAVREAARAWREEHPGETPDGLGYGRVTGPVVAAALAALEPSP